MRTIKISLFVFISNMLSQLAFAQAPSISYSPSSNTLTAGVSVSISPVNSGGAVPATTYGQVSTFAGSTTATTGYVNATGTLARFNWPETIVGDASGNLYVADANNNAIRMVSSSGAVTTFAGSATGASGNTDATGTAARFNEPDGLAIDASGNLYVSDYNNNAIRKITAAGVVSTFYHSSGTFGPSGLCFDASGNLIVAAQDLNQILKITSAGVVTTIAGSSYGYVNGTGTSAKFENPSDVKIDASGNLFVADYINNAIRKITSAGVVTTYAGSNISGNTGAFADGIGTAAKFNNPTSVSVGPGGVLYVADFLNNGIRRIMPDGTVSLVAGSPAQASGNTDGTGTAARFNQPDYLFVDGTGTAYIIELIGSRVRKMVLTGYTLSGTLPPGLTFDSTTGTITGTPTGPFPSQTLAITAYNAIGYSSTTLTLSGNPATRPNISYDVSTDTVAIGVPYTLSPLSLGGAVPATNYAQATTFAGSTGALSGYTNATGTSARFSAPAASVGDLYGNLYVADANNNAIRKIDPSGAVTTFAGSSTGLSGNTDAGGSSARFNSPNGIAIDASGNLFVSDYGNNSIRKITTGGVASTFYHSTGTFGPAGLLVDASGNIFVAAKDLHQILKITPAGVVSTIAGSTSGYTNANGSSAQFNGPSDVKMDTSGNLFVADRLNNAIRQIDPSGNVTTFAGSSTSGNTGAYLDDVGTAARFNSPAGLAIAPGGVLYVADLGNNSIRRITPDATVSFVAGSPSQSAGNTDGIGAAAAFNQPGNIYLDNSATAYITEVAGNRMRKFPLTGYSLAGALPAGLTMNPSTGVISGTPTGTLSPTVVAVNAFNTGGFFPVFIPLAGTTIDWRGTVSTDWSNMLNWTPNTRVPGSADNVRIGFLYSYTTQPTLNYASGTNTKVASVTFGSLAPLSTPILTINGGNTLTSSTAITIGANTKAQVNGPGTLLLFSNNTIPATGTFTIASSLVLQLNANAFITINNTAAGAFTIGSDHNGSASIAAITPGQITGAGAGQVSVQRELWGDGTTLANRGYRLLSSPVYQASVTSPANYNIYSINYLLNDCWLTSTKTYNPDGFDNPGIANPTLYLFNENHIVCNTSFTCGNFRGINNLLLSPTYDFDGEASAYNIPVGTGYLFFYRGNRADGSYIAETSTGYPPTETILKTTGTLNVGPVTYRFWYDPSTTSLSYSSTSGDPTVIGKNLAGNPYPSAIDWKQFSATSSSAGIYGPNVSTTVEELTSTSSSNPYGNYDVSGAFTNNASQYIASGAGFFVTATGSGASLTFNESAKSPIQALAGTGSFMTKSPVNQNLNQYIRLEMNADANNFSDIVIMFDKASKSTYEPAFEASYKEGFNAITLASFSSDRVPLGINKQPLLDKGQREIPLKVAATEDGNYHFNLRQVIGLPKIYDIILVDRLKKDSVDLRAKSVYDFMVSKSDSSTFGDKRFSLVFRQNPAYAYKLLDFNANKLQTARQVQVVWKTQNEGNYTNFTVERSTDGGKTFDVLGGAKAADQGQYSFLDKNPFIGQNLYRLKQEDMNNTISYSRNVPIEYTNKGDQLAGSKLNIYPNPASSTINLAIAADGTEPATYKIRFADAMGTVVKEVTSSQSSWQGNVSNLLPGTYLVRVINDKTQSLVGESKFVKL